MKSQIFTVVILLLLMVGNVYADPSAGEDRRFSVGGKLGLNIATYGGEDADRELVESTNTLGFLVGGFASIYLHRLVRAQFEVALTTKGTDAEVNGVYNGGYNLSYLEVPLMARVGVPLHGHIKPYVLAGPQISVLLSSEVEEDDGRTSDAKDDTQTLDVGLILGAGAAIKIPSLNSSVLVEVRYDWGLRKVYPDGPLDLQTRTLSILIGYQY